MVTMKILGAALVRIDWLFDVSRLPEFQDGLAHKYGRATSSIVVTFALLEFDDD